MVPWRRSGRRGGFTNAGRGGVSSSGRAGRAAWGPSTLQTSQVPQSPDVLELPSGEVIQSITQDDLSSREDGSFEGTKITEFSLLTSFNWVGRSAQPSILIPGEPPKWTPPADAERLSRDSGIYYRDQNAARCPAHPMEPVVLALLEKNVSVNGIDVMACGSTLRNLLRFVRGHATPFRVLVQSLGQTVFLIRRERSSTETIDDIKGYGHAFPEAYTTWSAEVAGSKSHQRIIKYNFGGLCIAMRYEGDGFITTEKAKTPAKLRDHQNPASTNSTLDGLTDAMAAGGIASQSNSTGGDISIQKKGQTIPQDQTFDIKTRAIYKKDQDALTDELPRLWMRQVPQFVLAHHTYGVFDDIEIHNVRDKVKVWEEEHQDELARFASLLLKIVELVRDRPDGKIELVCPVNLLLEARQQLPDAGEVLSDSVKARWERAVRSIDNNSQDPILHKMEGDDAGV